MLETNNHLDLHNDRKCFLRRVLRYSAKDSYVRNRSSNVMVALPGELQALKRFHGHLGPYVVIGYKMGQIGRERFSNRISAVVFTGSKRPLSCTIDGIQFSSSCTLGKNNIVVREENQVKAEFFDEKRLLSVELVVGIRERMDATTTRDNEEQVALDLFLAPSNELFRIIEGESAQSGRILKLR